MFQDMVNLNLNAFKLEDFILKKFPGTLKLKKCNNNNKNIFI